MHRSTPKTFQETEDAKDARTPAQADWVARAAKIPTSGFPASA